MTDSEDGSMLVGHRASRKFGGPEMYRVARRALTAGLPGKRMPNRRDRADDVPSECASFSALRSWTIAHC